MHKTTRRRIAAFILALGILAVPYVAHADVRDVGAAIETADSPRDAGASIEGVGTPGPNWSTPNAKPSRGDYATDLEYRMAVTGWEAAESARKANQKASK